VTIPRSQRGKDAVNGTVKIRPTMADSATPSDEQRSPTLLRALSTWDGTLLTIGSIIGTGIFLTTGDMAAALPHAGAILAVWAAAGLLTLAGALTYGELGALYPRAGGLYVFLREAYGPLWGFLYGWSGFLVIMSGGCAAIAVGFGEVLGGFVPAFSGKNLYASVDLGAWTWTLSGAQIAAALAILLLTAINHLGVREGKSTQNVLTWIKVGAIVVFAIAGLSVLAPTSPQFFAPLQSLRDAGASALGEGRGLLAAFGVAMISALWTFDGWYGLTFAAGEMKDPKRSLPRSLLFGTATVSVLYLLVNWVYLRALPIETLAGTTQVGEAAARALFGEGAARLLGAAVLVSTFGCLAATILYSSRLYQPIAQDGLFFRSLAKIHPVRRVPVASLWASGGWAIVLALSGTFAQLYTYVVFASVLFQVATGTALFVLRKKHPELPRPYRVWGYPWVPALFVLASIVLVVNTLIEKPVESIAGLGLVALGLPAYWMWRRQNAR
jgi:basic amino acid/polyamine antiporter, APA family